jgi:hypothetical protein
METKNSKAIPAKTKKLIYQEANSSCSLCDENDVNVLEIHHIEGRADGGSNEAENLLLVCSNCHSKITDDVIGIHEVYRAKIRLKNKAKSTSEKSLPSNVIRFERSVNKGIVANNLSIHTSTKSLKVPPPSDTIAVDRDKRNYIKHLIDRYNEFKKGDHNVKDFRYSIIYKAIQREFKCKWDYIPIEKFYRLVEYLQRRIDGTIIGKNRKGKETIAPLKSILMILYNYPWIILYSPYTAPFHGLDRAK